MSSYAEKLKDPRWQKRRLELLQAANWTCQHCGSKTETLHVHHGYYARGMEPWEYEDASMHVFCAPCHEYVQDQLATLHQIIGRAKPEHYTDIYAAIVQAIPSEGATRDAG